MFINFLIIIPFFIVILSIIFTVLGSLVWAHILLASTILSFTVNVFMHGSGTNKILLVLLAIFVLSFIFIFAKFGWQAGLIAIAASLGYMLLSRFIVRSLILKT